MPLKVSVALVIGFASIVIGALFENKPWAKWSEVLRIICFGLIPIYFVYWQSAPFYFIQISIGYAIVSYIWIFVAYKEILNIAYAKK